MDVFQIKFTYAVGDISSVGEAAGGDGVGEIDPVRGVIGFGFCNKGIVVAIVGLGVSKNEETRNLVGMR